MLCQRIAQCAAFWHPRRRRVEKGATTPAPSLALTDTGMGNENMLASGVGVEILDENQNDVSINNSASAVYPLKAGRNTLSFYIRYKSTQPVVTSGNATAVMYFDLQYE